MQICTAFLHSWISLFSLKKGLVKKLSLQFRSVWIRESRTLCSFPPEVSLCFVLRILLGHCCPIGKIPNWAQGLTVCLCKGRLSSKPFRSGDWKPQRKEGIEGEERTKPILCSWHTQHAPPQPPSSCLGSIGPRLNLWSMNKKDTSRMRFFCPKSCDGFMRTNPCWACWLWSNPEGFVLLHVWDQEQQMELLCIPSLLPAQGL